MCNGEGCWCCCSGGLSNWLYHVSLTKPLSKPVEPTQVLMRLYGQTHGERGLESLITDSVIFTLLSERGLGPRLHGIFPGGRIEEYIPVSTVPNNILHQHMKHINIYLNVRLEMVTDINYEAFSISDPHVPHTTCRIKPLDLKPSKSY